MSSKPAICFVTAGGDHPWAIANALAARFGDGIVVVQEEPESKRDLIIKRARKLGWFNVAGQLGTMVAIRLGKSAQSARIRAFIKKERLDVEPLWNARSVRVPSVNDEAFASAIAAIKPDLIVLAGCRLMRAAMLQRLPCPVINYHPGVTPKYRGMNGGYWALANGEPEKFGSTIHFVDKGVDTGVALAQVICRPEPGDTIMTYPYTIAAASRPAVVKVVEDVLSGAARPIEPKGESAQWYHPPIWTWVWNGLIKGVW